MKRHRPWLWFLAVEVIVLSVLYRDALWGASLLAPLDIAPNLFAKFQYLDPQANGVPANHHSIDALTFDLPVQYTIHQALRRGEIPWWDPYTLGGWPLLAESHSNAFDPARLLAHFLLPFELAYNWARAIHSFLCGLGMFLLLRRLDYSLAPCILLATAFQAAGCITFFFQQPWIEAVFAWYPFLWLTWEAAYRQRRWRYTVLASILVAACLYSGSLQSHSYLVLFAIGLGCGYAGRSWTRWRQWLLLVVMTGFIGACLAAPVLVSQVELFLLSDRTVALSRNPLSWLSGAASLTAVFPWCLGSFRTLDLSRLLGQTTLGFCLFIGSAAVVLAVLGALNRANTTPERSPLLRAALALVVIYLIILSTPLIHIFYYRSSALAAMGLTILAAHGFETVRSHAAVGRAAGWATLALAVVLALALHTAAWVVYPRMLPRVRQIMTKYDASGRSLDSAPKLRAHQIEVLPREVTFANPSALLAWLSLAGLAGWLLQPGLRERWFAGTALLTLNLVPVLIVGQQFVPRHPIQLWDRLREGGPEQRKIMARLQGSSLRLREIAPGPHEMAMPLALPLLYQVRCVHGYASVRPRGLTDLSAHEQETWSGEMSDWIYQTDERGKPEGTLRPNLTADNSRFQWRGPLQRRFTVEDLTLCQMRLKFEPGPSGTLLWTDTFYPGWTARADGAPVAIKKHPPCFSTVAVPENATELVLRFRPRLLGLSMALAGAGWAALAFVAILARFRHNEESTS